VACIHNLHATGVDWSGIVSVSKYDPAKAGNSPRELV